VTVRRGAASFNIAYIPDDGPEADDPLKFDPVQMRNLYEIGQMLGRSGRTWHSEQPPARRIGTEAITALSLALSLAPFAAPTAA